MAHQAKTARHSVRTETPDLDEEIHRRAYELYEERGRENGHDFDDWLRAEEEITNRKARTIAA